MIGTLNIGNMRTRLFDALRVRWYEARRKHSGWASTLAAMVFFALLAVLAIMAIVALVLAIIAAVTLLPAVLIWLAWNFIAPQFDAIPMQYQQIEFMTIWGITVLLMALRGVIKSK